MSSSRSRPSIQPAALRAPSDLERAKRDVIAVWIPQRELLCLRIPIDVRFLCEARNERAGGRQDRIEIVDTKEQQQPVSRGGGVGARQRRMLMLAPLVQTEENGPIGI